MKYLDCLLMNKDKINILIPKLRFPEFKETGDWENKTLSEICFITNGKSNAQDHIENGKYPLFDRSEVIKASNTFIFDTEAVIIPGEGMRFNPKYFSGKFDLHQRAYVLKDFISVGLFVYYSMVTNSDLLSLKAVRSTVLSLRLPTLQNFPIIVPKGKSEQQKIADCLSSLDDLITAQNQKLEALKVHKKGLMKQLFPAEGETVPKLRFEEFRESGEWEEKSLGTVANIITGSTPSTQNSNYYGGNINFVSPADISERRYIYKTKTTLTPLGFKLTRRIKANSVLFVCIGSTIGKIAQNKFECCTNQQLNSLVPFDGYSSDFLYSALQHNAGRIALMAGIQAVPIINKSLFSSVLIVIPGFSEQKKIGECILALDELLNSQSEEINLLKLHKKAMMQQLFPAVF